jgi:hypothetical protein
MPTKRQRANIKRVHETMERQRKLNELKRKGVKLIPMSVLKALQDMALPSDKALMTQKLQELLGA